MLASFANMGALYEHDPYDTLAEEWNTYPWVLGWDNRFELKTESSITTAKTRWDGIGDTWDEDDQGIVRALNLTITMNATLIRFDMWGNIGSDTDTNDPDPIPDEWLIVPLSASIANITTTQSYFPNYFDSNAESNSEVDGNLIAVTGAVISNIQSS